MKRFLLPLLLTVASVSVAKPLLQPSVVMAQAPYFSTNAELEAKFRRVKIGWTYAQVEALLGQPQWGGRTEGVYNYYVNQKTMVKAISFRNGRVFSLGVQAG